jgi:transcriptional regulator with XRE-family HTH domain
VGIGEAIRVRRERAGLTQETLGALLGVHPNDVDEWEWGEAAPHPALARRLASILGFPEQALMVEAPGDAVVVRLVAGVQGPAASGDAIVVRFEAGRAAAPGPARAGFPGLVSVPPRPSYPPPLPIRPVPGPDARGTPVAGRRRRPAPARAAVPAWVRRGAVGVVAALLIGASALAGASAVRQGQLAAQYEAEARALRNILVVLAGERDRLAARIGDLTAMLVQAGVVPEGTPASIVP